jgi:hypothetical protein
VLDLKMCPEERKQHPSAKKTKAPVMPAAILGNQKHAVISAKTKNIGLHGKLTQQLYILTHNYIFAWPKSIIASRSVVVI